MATKQLPLAGTATMTLVGRVQKLIADPYSKTSGKVQIIVVGADDLYGELRLPNILQNERGQEVALIPDAEIEIVMTVNVKSTTRDDQFTGQHLRRSSTGAP